MRSALQIRLLFVILIVGMAFFLRIWRLDVVPLRGDEAFTALHLTHAPFTERFQFFLEREPSPVLMVVYWAWSSGTGISEFALRYFGVLSNLFGVAVIIALARRLFVRWDMALIAGGLWAIHPFLIWHAQDARQYGLYVTLAVFNIYLLHRVLHNKKPRWWAYILFQTFTLYYYYFELFMIIPQVLYVWMYHRKQFGRFVRVWVGISILLIPLAIQLYGVLFGHGYTGNATSADIQMLFTEFVPTLLWGGVLGEAWMGMAIALGLFVIAWFIPLIFTWAVVPLGMLFILSQFTPIFLPRYVIAVVPAFILIISSIITIGIKQRYAIGSTVITTENRMRSYFAVALVAVLCLSQTYAYFYTDPPKSFDWRGLMTYVDARSSADDLIINDTSDTALEYYHQGEINIFFIPDDNPLVDSYLPALFSSHRSIFLLTGARTGNVQIYLRTHAQRLPTSWNGLEHFRHWDIDPTEIDAPLAVQFEDVARLVGYTWLGDDVLLLYWEALRQTDEPYNILTHLTTALNAPPDGAILDHQIADNKISTATWDVGTIYRDPIIIPDNLANGDYHLLIGMYSTTPPYTRLSVDGKNEDGRVVLMTISR